MRTLSALLAAGATALTLTAAAPSTGSAGGSSSESGGARSAADRRFLRGSNHDDEDCDVQNAAIRRTRSECRWLDAHGNSAANQIGLAESTRDALKYP
ncbi:MULTISPECIES: hypothetical protein [unclassified Nocardia]|uniref:hypothetical protein n=1 Tax=unclassified Nocardia TaxID=2637762 RepID=UPI0033A8F2E4